MGSFGTRWLVDTFGIVACLVVDVLSDIDPGILLVALPVLCGDRYRSLITSPKRAESHFAVIRRAQQGGRAEALGLFETSRRTQGLRETSLVHNVNSTLHHGIFGN